MKLFIGNAISSSYRLAQLEGCLSRSLLQSASAMECIALKVAGQPSQFTHGGPNEIHCSPRCFTLYYCV